MSDFFQNNQTGGHGGDLEAALKKWKIKREDLTDFSSNINPLGPPPGLIEHLIRIMPEMSAYPTPGARKLRLKLASYYKIPPERIIIGNGATELIHLLTLWLKPKRVFIPAPSFSEYERASRLAGAGIIYYPLLPEENFDEGQLARKFQRGDLVFFCNPCNPTGKIYTRGSILGLVEKAREKGVRVIIDESFIPLSRYEKESLRGLELANLWVITSLTKVWGLPGLRLGFAVGETAQVEKINRWGDPWRVNFLAQEAGIYSIEKGDYVEEALNLIDDERNYLASSLEALGVFHVYRGAANYLLVRSDQESFTAEKIQEELARKGILIRRADNFPGLDHRYFRIAVRTGTENRLLTEAIGELVKQ